MELPSSFVDLFATALGAVFVFLLVMFVVARTISQDAKDTRGQLTKSKDANGKCKKEKTRCKEGKSAADANNKKLNGLLIGMRDRNILFRNRYQKALDELDNLKQQVVLIVERPVDLVFVIDATSSMSDDIDVLKKKLRHIARLASYLSKRIRIGLVIYRDRYNATVVEKQELTSDIDTAIRFLSTITTQSSPANRDYAEAVYQGLYTAIHRMNWGDGARTLILVGDAEAYLEKRAEALKLIRTFTVDDRNTLSCICLNEPRRRPDDFDRNVASFFREMAKAGRGQYVELDDSILLVRSILRLIWSKRSAALQQLLNRQPTNKQPAGI